MAAAAESCLDSGEERGLSGVGVPSVTEPLPLSAPDSPPAPRRSMNIEDGARPRLPLPPAAAR